MIPKKLHYQSNWFKALFAIMSKSMTDAETGQLNLFFKMTFKSDVFVYGDKSKSEVILHCKRSGRWAYNWEILDMEAGGAPIGVITWDVIGTVTKLGGESWKIYDRDKKDGGKEVLKLETEEDSAVKRIADAMSDLLYNPGYVYTVKTPGGKDIARIFVKHGWWRQYYDFELLGGDKNEQKLALAIFAILTLLMKK